MERRPSLDVVQGRYERCAAFAGHYFYKAQDRFYAWSLISPGKKRIMSRCLFHEDNLDHLGLAISDETMLNQLCTSASRQ
jgi:hypothetical protein